MKKSIIILLIFAITWSTVGCDLYVDKDAIVGAVEDKATEIIENEKKEAKEKATTLWNSIWNKRKQCNHEPVEYQKNLYVVVCKCGENDFPDLEYDVFVEILKIPFWKKDKNEYAVKEYAKYIAKGQLVDPSIMGFLMIDSFFNVSEEDSTKLSELTKAIESISGQVEDAAEVDDLILENLPVDQDDFFVDVGDYFGSVSDTLHIVNTTMDIRDFSEAMKEGSNKKQIFITLTNSLKGLTNIIPVWGNYFDKSLDVVAEGLVVLAEADKIDMVRQTVLDHVSKNLTDSIFLDKPWVNLEVKRNWKDGPSLVEIAQTDLPPEILAGISPYIEYRINYEFEQIFEETYQEMAKKHLD